jgi:hypothetical protein
VKRACGCGCEPNVFQLTASSTGEGAPCPEDPKLQGARRKSRWRRFAGWIAPAVPATLLAIMPKCPMCLAAYVTLIAGIGLSAQAATALRVALIALCVASLTFLLARRLRWLAGKWNSHNSLIS